MKSWERKYRNQFIVGMIGYIILLPVSLFLIGRTLIENQLVLVAVTLVPVLPLLYAMGGVVGNARNQDEMKRQIHYEAVLVTALLTGGLTFSYGLLERAGILPPLTMVIIAPFMILVWGAARVVITRRYGS
ncbi:MAG: hypothetical protein R3335_05100 [Anaerolineales bacterium]|nr:hypothetical protein [Anaerolineales bacterium]